MSLARRVLDVAAEVESRFSGQENIGQDEIGVHVGEPRKGGFAVGQADHFEAFFAQDSLAHPLCVRAIVRQQDPVHQGWPFGFWVAGGFVAGWLVAGWLVAGCGFTFFGFFFLAFGSVVCAWSVLAAAPDVASAGLAAALGSAGFASGFASPPAAGAAPVRASGRLSRADLSAPIGFTVTSPVNPGVPFVIGTLTGTVPRNVVIAGSPDFAAALISGPRLMMFRDLESRLGLVRFSASHFIRL